MSQDKRAAVAAMWDEAWTKGLWAAAWSKSVDGLTPEQAAWQPASAPGVEGTRHSIWQNVEHIIYWRENWLGRLGGARSTPEQDAAGNFPIIRDASQGAWDDARRRFRETHERIGAALRERGPEADPLMHFLPHDAYHIGQINQIRAMQGLSPIE